MSYRFTTPKFLAATATATAAGNSTGDLWNSIKSLIASESASASASASASESESAAADDRSAAAAERALADESLARAAAIEALSDDSPASDSSIFASLQTVAVHLPIAAAASADSDSGKGNFELNRNHSTSIVRFHFDSASDSNEPPPTPSAVVKILSESARGESAASLSPSNPLSLPPHSQTASSTAAAAALASARMSSVSASAAASGSGSESFLARDLSVSPSASVLSLLELFSDPSPAPFPSDIFDRMAQLTELEFQQCVDGMTQRRLQSSIGKFNALLPEQVKFSPHHYSFHHISYTDSEGRTLLRNVSGFLKPKSLTALIGASDSGSTVLLDILTNRFNHSNSPGRLSGSILIDGAPPGKNFRRIVGYCSKDDFNLPSLTVKETLEFNAKLRIPTQIPAILRKFRIYMMLKIFNLSHVSNSFVGDSNGMIRGLSGGERRRLTFSLQMLAGHSIMIGNQVTNGLDSNSSLSLFLWLKAALHNGLFSCLTTVLQPSIELLDLFDSILLLSKGSTLFYGPKSHCLQHLNAQGFQIPLGKSLPSFLEELSARPEKFWVFKTIPPPVRLSPLQYSEAFNEFVEEITRRDQPDHEPQTGKNSNSNSHSQVAMGFSLSRDGIVKKFQQILDSKRAQANGNNYSPLRNPNDKEIAESESGSVHVNVSDSAIPLSQSASVSSHSHSPSSSCRAAWGRLWIGFENSIYNSDLQHHSNFYMNRLAIRAINQAEAGVETVAVAKMAKSQNTPRVSVSDESAIPPFASSFLTQITACTYRWLLLTRRNRGMWIGVWLRSIVIGLLLGSLFWNIGISQTSIRTRMGLLYFILTFLAGGAIQLISVLESQRAVFNEQVEAKYYHGFAYYIGYAVVQIPIAIVESFLLILIVYGMANLANGIGSIQFLYAFLTLSLFNLIARSIVLLLSAVTPNQLAAQALTATVTILCQLFAGFLSARALIPLGWQFMYHISYFTYALKGLAVSQFNHIDRMDCPANGGACPYKTGPEALGQYDMISDPSDSIEWQMLSNLLIFYLTINFAAGMAMQFITFKPAIKEEGPNFYENEYENENESATKLYHSDNQTETEMQPILVDQIQVESKAQSHDRNHSHSTSTICWNHLNYDVEVSREKSQGSRNKKNDSASSSSASTSTKRLLNECFGFATSKGLTALMGNSGAGKTTLMDVLAGKKTTGSIRGEFYFNGHRLPFSRGNQQTAQLENDNEKSETNEFTHEFGYVEQFDSLMPFSTVRESIDFSAQLRCPRSWTQDKIENQIHYILRVLELESLQHELVGSMTNELKKKIAIACELVTAPKILFADEPTTSLTSFGALAVMKSLHRLSASMAVVCTIHQPSSEIVSLFSSLLLCHSGEVAYFGPISSVVDYFCLEQNLSSPPSSDRNVTDFALQVLNRAKNENIDVIKRFRESHRFQAVMQQIHQLSNKQSIIRVDDKHNAVARDDAAVQHEVPIQAASDSDSLPWSRLSFSPISSFFIQFRHLLARFWCIQQRDLSSIRTRIGMSIWIGFIVSTLFTSLGYDQLAASSRFSCVYMIVSFIVGLSMIKLPENFIYRSIYFREKSSGFYSTESLILARFIADIPMVLIETFVFVVMVYFIADLTQAANGTRFAALYFVLIGTRMATIQLIAAISSLVSTIEAGSALCSVSTTVATLFSGFLIAAEAIPSGWLWMHYLSFVRYPLFFAVQNEMASQDSFTCPARQNIQIRSATQYSNLLAICPNSQLISYNSSLPFGYLKCPLQCGNELLTNLGIHTNYEDRLLNGGLIYLFCFAFLFISYLGTKYINHIKR